MKRPKPAPDDAASPDLAGEGRAPSAEFLRRCAAEDVPPRTRTALWALHRRWKGGSGDEEQRLERLLADYREWSLYVRSRHGDERAARQFEERWRPLAGAILGRRVPPGEVGEITSAFFARLYRSVGDDFAWHCPFGVYLRAMLVNLARDAHRQRVRREAREAPLPEVGTAAELADSADGPLEKALQRERAAAVARAFQALTPAERRLLEDCVLEGRPAAEVAREVGVPRNAVYQRIYRARQHFRALLDREGVR